MISGFYVTRKVRGLNAKHAASESRQTGYLADSITNILAVKSFAGITYEKRNFRKYADTTHDNTLEIMRASQKQMLFFSIMNRITMISALLLAIAGVALFRTEVSTVFLIFTFTSNLLGQLWNFCNSSLRSYNRALGDAKDMLEILEIETEVKDVPKPMPFNAKRGEISFENVTFTHDGAGDSLFSNLSLNIQPGEKIGLVGHSGSGKSSLVRVLLRFSDVDNGRILIDGQDISKVRQDDLHSAMAYVPQEPIMFHRMLSENIQYGDFSADTKKIIAASKAANAHDFIEKLPEKYHTLVGERGVKLSGGQRQRIAIARAILKDAPILVLDEATSALDSESEVLIQDALKKLMEGRTTIVVAHRLSTIQKMDRIIVLDNGKIVEEGSHTTLLKKNGTYAQLWAHQSGGFIEE